MMDAECFTYVDIKAIILRATACQIKLIFSLKNYYIKI